MILVNCVQPNRSAKAPLIIMVSHYLHTTNGAAFGCQRSHRSPAFPAFPHVPTCLLHTKHINTAIAPHLSTIHLPCPPPVLPPPVPGAAYEGMDHPRHQQHQRRKMHGNVPRHQPTPTLRKPKRRKPMSVRMKQRRRVRKGPRRQ